MADLREPWTLAGHELPNRLVLAPLAGIGNWFVRLQAQRYGAGLVVSEMVSSFGLKYGDERTHREFLRIHPDEHPVSIQLFGHDAEVMRIAAGIAAEAGADMIDLNMGCPVRKVCKTGAGASLLDDPDKAVAIASAAREGSGLPVTVKFRSGNRPGERTGVELALRLVDEAGRRGDRFPPAPRLAAAQGHARLRARGRAGGAARRPGDHLRRARDDEHTPQGLRAQRRGRGDARARLARQPVALPAAARPARRRAHAARRSRTSCAGSSTAPRSTSASSAPAATCASSTPGTRETMGLTKAENQELLQRDVPDERPDARSPLLSRLHRPP